MWIGFAIAVLVLLAYNLRQWRRDVLALANWKAELSQKPAMPQDLTISALVAAWNEDDIEAHIQSFKALRYPKKQLVLVAGGGATYEKAIACADESIIVLPQQAGKGKQVALKDGFSHTQGEIIFLTDADCLFDNKSFERTLSPILSGEAVASSGFSRPLADNSALVAIQWANDFYNLLYSPDESAGLKGCNCAIRRDVLAQTGGFDSPAPSGTDYTLARQLIMAGHTIKNVRGSLVQTAYPNAVRDYFFTRVRWLRNLLLIGRRTNDAASFRASMITLLLSLIFLALPVLALLLSVWFPMLGMALGLFWLLLFIHAAFSRWRYLALVDNRSVFPKSLLVLFLDQLMALRVLVESLVPSLSRWK